jgi:fucose 4-O-acetylase-like acetyltransferase
MIRWINNLKGFGILLVVLGHLIPREGFGQWIYAFHVPLFFYLSGFLFSIRPANQWGGINSQLRRLIFPFYFWSIICLVINFIIAGIWYPDKIHKLIIYSAHVALGSGQNGLKELGLSLFPIWFIPPLFFSNILFIYIKKNVDNIIWQVVIASLLSILGFGLFDYGRTIPFRIDVTLISIPMVWIGFYHNRIINRVNNLFTGLILVLIGTFANIINIKVSSVKSVEIVLQIIGNPLLFYISAITISMGIFVMFEKLLKESSISEYYGRNSMVIMTFHFPVIYFLKRTLSIDDFSYFILVSIIMYMVIRIVEKYIPWSFNFKLLRK